MCDCCDKTQTYVGANGDLFVGDIDTTVYTEGAYLICTVPNANYDANLTLNQALAYGDDAVLTNPTTITLAKGKRYRITFNANIEPTAALPIVVKVLINGAESKIFTTLVNAVPNSFSNVTLVTYYDSNSGAVTLQVANASSAPFYQVGSLEVDTLGNS